MREEEEDEGEEEEEEEEEEERRTQEFPHGCTWELVALYSTL